MKWLNHDARFDALDMIYFGLVVGFAAFLIAASVFVGLGTDPGTLPVWIQTVFVAVGTLIALIKYNYDRLRKREEAIAAELIAASRTVSYTHLTLPTSDLV